MKYQTGSNYVWNVINICIQSFEEMTPSCFKSTKAIFSNDSSLTDMMAILRGRRKQYLHKIKLMLLFYFTWYNWLTSLLTFFTATLLPPLPLPSLFTIVLLVEVSLLFLTCTSLSLNSASYSPLSSSSIANTLLLTSNSVDLQSKLSIYTTDSFAGLLLNILSSESKNTNFEIRYCSPCCLV